VKTSANSNSNLCATNGIGGMSLQGEVAALELKEPCQQSSLLD
jgi:hypothetical protein